MGRGAARLNGSGIASINWRVYACSGCCSTDPVGDMVWKHQDGLTAGPEPGRGSGYSRSGVDEAVGGRSVSMTPRRRFVVADDAGLADVLRRLGEQLELIEEPPVTGEVSWLDTADRRVSAAGLTLRVERAEVTQLILADLAGDAELERVEVDRPPRWAADLPAGPLGSRVGPLLDVRALLPLASAVVERRVARVLDGEAKTVARIVAETLSGGELQPLRRLRVAAVRGYDRAAGRVARRLAGDPALRPADLPTLHMLLGADPAAGADRPAAPPLRRDLTAEAAYRRLLTHLLETLTSNVEGTVAAIDTEFLHDLRVAVRRTRSVLKFAEQVLPDDDRERYAVEFKWLGDMTTGPRDLDVHLLGFDAMRAALPGDEADAVEPFRQLLLREQHQAQEELAGALRSRRFDRLLTHWAEVLARPVDPQAAGQARVPIGEVTDERIARVLRRVLRRGAAIDDRSPDEALHDLRKRCKELRYALELFGSLYDRPRVSAAVRELKVLQDNLGEFQDTAVQRDVLRAYADQLRTEGAPVSTLLAMGRLAGALDDRQVRARREFTLHFARFASGANRKRFATLLGGHR